MTETKNTERLDVLFNDLVPEQGKAESVAGELVRAASRRGILEDFAPLIKDCWYGELDELEEIHARRYVPGFAPAV